MNLHTAATEYANRPADERYASPSAMLEAAQHDRQHSREVSYQTRDLTVVPTVVTAAGAPLQAQPGQATAIATSLSLQSPRGQASFTHWSFGQLARMVGAPASYLRELPAGIAAEAINYGLHESTEHATDAKLLVRANGEQPVIRACTSETYGRVWDADLYGAVLQTLGQDDWQTPPTWTGEPAGAYRGDRDSFLILVDGGSIVTDPSLRATDGPSSPLASGGDPTGLYRGVMLRNSEVGASSIAIDLILFRFICGNHLIWGGQYQQRFRRRHTGAHAGRDALRTIYQAARQWAQTPASADERIILDLTSRELAHTRDAVIDELRALGATREQATAAYDTCEQTERVSPRSYWGAAQGLTRISQASGYQDQRFELDQVAAAVLARGRNLVTV
jgi:hypothetical protein